MAGSGDRAVTFNAELTRDAVQTFAVQELAGQPRPTSDRAASEHAASENAADELSVDQLSVDQLSLDELAAQELANSDHDDTVELTGNWGHRRRDSRPVLPSSTRDDTDAGWGERTSDNDAWLRDQRPPHWD